LLSIGIHAALVGISLITWTAAPALRPALQEPVVLQAIIRRDGRVDVLNLVRSLGFGLGQNAIEALKQWRFRPATKDGQAVDSTINIEVRFNLR
jgi:protein TonB